jgi:GDP-4-dehydro-6-deoxy-D-mannose reductase
MAASVFITGIEGFVGVHLARHLAGQGLLVSGTYYVTPLADLSFARTHYCDIRNAAHLQAVLAEEAPHYVIHLAAISSVALAEQDFSDTIDINVRGTLHLLEAIRARATRPRVLLISSSEVYDRQAVSPDRPKLDEGAPVRPLNNYSLSKLLAEQLGRYYSERHGLDIVTLRPFSHTGPGQSTSFVFPSVARQIAEVESGKRAPEIEVGNTEVSRDYTDIRDICRAYELALTRTTAGEVYNVTSEQTLRIGAGIEYLLSLAAAPVTTRVAATRVRQESVLLAGSGAKFRAATGWQAEFDIRQTLRDLLDYQRQLLRAAEGLH